MKAFVLTLISGLGMDIGLVMIFIGVLALTSIQLQEILYTDGVLNHFELLIAGGFLVFAGLLGGASATHSHNAKGKQ